MTLRNFHKWLSVAIGAQILVWVASGTIISLLDQEIVSGKTTKNTPILSNAIGADNSFFPISELKIINKDKVSSIILSNINNKLSYQINSDSELQLFDAYSGAAILISKEIARSSAQNSYRGNASIIATQLLPNGSDEARAVTSMWRVQFDDDKSTRIYVSAADGSVIAHRNRYWKVVDFLLMLHFMDYAREHNFNNIQIILVAFAALWLALSGLLLVKRNFTKRDFTWLGISR